MIINYLNYCVVPKYSEIFEKNVTDEEFVALLSSIPCGKAIFILSRFESLQRECIKNDEKAVDLYLSLKEFHFLHILTLGGDNKNTYNNYKLITCPNAIFMLEKLALRYCPICNISVVTLDDILTIMDLLLCINEKLPEDDVINHEVEFLYLTLFYNDTKKIANQIARSYYIFSEIIKENPSLAIFIEECNKKSGFSVEDRLTVLFASLTNTIPREFTIRDVFYNYSIVPIDGFDAKGLSDVYIRVMQSLSCDYGEMRSEVEKILDLEWNFEPFYRKPFLKIGDELYPLAEPFVVYQMWEGLYWNLRYTLPADGERFMTQFGTLFESYVREITQAAVSESGLALFQDEFFYYRNKNKIASSDCYFRVENTIVVVEAKAKSPSSGTLTKFNRGEIEKEVDDLIVSPVNQALARLEEITSRNVVLGSKEKQFFSNIKEVIILSVSIEKVQPIGELLAPIDKSLAEEMSVAKVTAYHNVNIEEFEIICDLLESKTMELSSILTDWYQCQRKDKLSAVLLRNYLHENKISYNSSKRVLQIFDEVNKKMYKRTFDEEMPNR